MDQSEAKKLVHKYFRTFQRALHLNNWHFHFVYGPITVEGERVMGRCATSPERYDCTIELDPQQHDDDEEFVDTLRHEMLHVLHADMQTLRRCLHELLSEGDFKIVAELENLACERIVSHLEFMLDHGLGLKPEAMVQRVKDIAAKAPTASECLVDDKVKSTTEDPSHDDEHKASLVHPPENYTEIRRPDPPSPEQFAAPECAVCGGPWPCSKHPQCRES